jgi:hypothetical protein
VFWVQRFTGVLVLGAEVYWCSALAGCRGLLQLIHQLLSVYNNFVNIYPPGPIYLPYLEGAHNKRWSNDL